MGIRRRHIRRKVDVPLNVDSGITMFTPAGYRRISCAEYHRVVKPQMQAFDQLDPALRALINGLRAARQRRVDALRPGRECN